MKNRTAKALLKENRKALQFLHETRGFDFEKPFFIKRLEGRFTFNQVTKEITSKLSGRYSAAILVKPNEERYFQKLHYCDIDFKFEPLNRCGNKNYYFDIDTFFSVGDFEETRKQKTKHVYIVAQNSEYLRLPNYKKIDSSKRYDLDFEHWHSGTSICGDGHGNSWINKIYLKERDGSRARHIYEPFHSFYWGEKQKSGTDINNYIDKSGYLIRIKRQDLRCRAKALKAERDKAALLKADFTDEETRIFAKLEEAKKQLADAVLNAQTIEDGARVSRAAARLYYAVLSAEKYPKRDFASIDEKRKALDFLSSDIGLITTALEGE